MGEEKIKWHPAFAAAIQLELKEYDGHFDYKVEHQLTDEPLKIDVVVIKKLDDIKIDKIIGKIFKKYNILEYKSPTDYFSIDDYYKVKAYAYLYKALTNETNAINVEEITITIVSSKYPKKLIKYLKEKQNASIKEVEKGIYYIENTDIKTQLIVNNKELKDEEAKYLKLLQMEQSSNDLLRKWINEYIKNTKNPLYAAIMNVLAESNPNELMEVYKNMGEAKLSEANMEFLLSMMKKMQLDKKLKEEGIAEGIEKGIEKGIEEGIEKGKIATATEMILDDEPIDKIKKYSKLSEEEIMKLKNKLLKK